MLGATGLIGNAVVRALLGRGHTVTGTCRQPGTALNLQGLGLSVARGDLDVPGQLHEWIKGHDVVVDAAAPYPLHLMVTAHGASKPTVEYARRRTATLLDGLARHEAKLVHVSTLLAKPGYAGQGLSGLQRRMMRILHPYFAIKACIEQALATAANRVPGIAIVQPSSCMGPYDIKPADQCLVPKLVKGKVAISASHDLNVVDTRDLAEGIVAVIESERYGQTLPFIGHNTSVDDTLLEFERIGGHAAPRWRFPAELGVLPTYWAEFAWAAIGQPSPLPSLLPVLICEQHWMEMDAAQTSLGISLRPLGETLRDTVSWYRELGYC